MCNWLYDIFCCPSKRNRAKISPNRRESIISKEDTHNMASSGAASANTRGVAYTTSADIHAAAAAHITPADGATPANATHSTAAATRAALRALHASATAHAARTTQLSPTPSSLVAPAPGLSIVIHPEFPRSIPSTLPTIPDAPTPQSQFARFTHAAT
jgi:hypothetical protein